MLCRLAYLRYDGPEVSAVAEQLFARQQPDGSWPLWLDEQPAAARDRGRGPRRPRSETYTTVPIQTALPLRGLAAATHEAWSLGWDVARLLGLAPSRGRFTFYARVDLAFLLDLATRCETPVGDQRLAALPRTVEPEA